MQRELNGEKGIYRKYDSSALQIIPAWQKVLQILKGEIPVPEVVEIFPTNFCDFNCPHCRFKDYHGGNSQYLDKSSLENLLKELHEKGVKALELSGGGEPLVYPHIEDLFEKALENGIRVGLITNGYKFTQSEKLKKLALESCNWIRFSLDAFTDETYRKVHGKQDITYSEIRKVISDVISMAKDTPKIEIKMLISKANKQECKIAIREAINLGVNCLQFKFLGNHEAALSDSEMSQIKDSLYRVINKSKKTGVRVELVPPYNGPPSGRKCLMTYLHPVIDWDGQIYVCAFFEHRKKEHSLGNIHNGGFFKHWNSPHHIGIYNAVDPCTCIPKCPMQRYEPLIDFIKSDSYRFPFI